MILQSPEKTIEEISKAYFVNEDVSPRAFHALDDSHRRALCLEAALCEFLNQEKSPQDVRAAAQPQAGNDTLNGEKYNPESSLSVVYFNKILATKGDVTKTPNYANNRTLVGYAKQVAQTQPESKEGKTFLVALGKIEDALDNLVKYKADFAKAIREESEKTDGQSSIVAQYYMNLVVMIDVNLDVLYSTSIQAEFDRNVRPSIVRAVSFQMREGAMDESLAIVHNFNSLAFSGKLRQAIDEKNVAVLGEAKRRVLKEESIIDVAFSLIASNRWTELLLLPLYTIRSVVYTVKYLTASYQRLKFSISQSVEFIRKTKVTEEEFRGYKADADKKFVSLDQASKKAAIEVSRDIKENKQEIGSLAKDVSNRSAGGAFI